MEYETEKSDWLLKRREFLKTGLAAAFASSGLYAGLSSAEASLLSDGKLYWSALRKPSGSFGMAVLDATGRLIWETDLPDRGHGAAIEPIKGHIAVTERRPGWYGEVIQAQTGEKITELTLPEGRHYFGHAIYAGAYLYTPESAYDEGRGLLGVWDVADNYRRIGEIDLDGIGPHELVRNRDGSELIVAVGGILTHPDEGRLKLNLQDMRPKLVWIDTRTQSIKASWEPEQKWHQASIRHLAVSDQGDVCFGMQYQGSKKEHAPIFGVAHDAENVVLSVLPDEIVKSHHNYCGSVQLDQSGALAAASTPRGNKVLFFDVATGNYHSQVEIQDACGVCQTDKAGEFLISNGLGEIVLFDVVKQKKTSLAKHDLNWDNHLYQIVI